MINRRTLIKSFVGATSAGLLFSAEQGAYAADAKTLKISHQFPGGTSDKGDFRDRLTRKFAQDVEKRTKGELK